MYTSKVHHLNSERFTKCYTCYFLKDEAETFLVNVDRNLTHNRRKDTHMPLPIANTPIRTAISVIPGRALQKPKIYQ